MIRLRIIYHYVFREIVVSFVFAFAVLLVAGLIAGFLPLLQKGMESGLELTLILFQVLASALPGTLVTVLPLSMMIGILLGLGRMAADNEVAALKSAGISVLRLLPACGSAGGDRLCAQPGLYAGSHSTGHLRRQEAHAAGRNPKGRRRTRRTVVF